MTDNDNPNRLPRIPLPVQWHEGMQLMPQHFQQADMRHDILSIALSRAAHPFYWGVVALDINEEALRGGTLEIRHLDVVLKDGLVLQRDAESDDPLVYDLTESKDILTGQPRRIFVEVPEQRPGDAARGEESRFISVPSHGIVDESTGDNPIDIPRLIPRLSIEIGDRPSIGSTGVPILSVQFVEGEYRPTEFAPPALRVRKTDLIGKICTNLTAAVRAKSAQLAEASEGFSAIGAGAVTTMQQQLSLQNLFTSLPGLEVRLDTEVSHPFDLYCALADLVGQLTAIRLGTIPDPLPRYDHDEPLKAFRYCAKTILGIMDEFSVSFTSLPFTAADAGFSIELTPQLVRNRLLIGVRMRPGVAQGDTMDWIDGATICAVRHLPTLKKNRSLGITRRQTDRDDEYNVVPPAGTILYSLDNWQEFLATGETLTVQPTDVSNERSAPQGIVLYVPTRRP